MSKKLTPGDAVRRELRLILSDTMPDEDTTYVPEEMLDAQEYERIAQAAVSAHADSLYDANRLSQIVAAAQELLSALDVAGVACQQAERLRKLV